MEAIDESYESNRTIFLAASVNDLSVDLNNSVVNGTIEDFKFVVNGVELSGTSPKPPYFNQWTPPSAGKYEVYAIARDSLGNYGISKVYYTEVKEDLTL